MNFENQKVSGVNELSVQDSLNAPLIEFKLSKSANSNDVTTNDLIIYVDTNDSLNPTFYKKSFYFELNEPLRYYNQVADEFVLQTKVTDNDVIMEAYVKRKIGLDGEGLYLLSSEEIEDIDCFPITLFEGTNYIYSNYENANIEFVYSKNDVINQRFVNSALFYVHKEKKDGEFSLDDIYFKDAFTKEQDKINMEIANGSFETITSSNNTFSLDEEGNLIVNSLTISGGLNNSILNLIYPVGSIYMSTSSVNPSNIFGGTWEQIQGKFLLGCSENYLIGTEGGESTHTLTTNEIPSHTHSWSQSSCTNPGNHTHIVGADKDGGAGSNRYTVHITNNNTASGQQYSPVSGGAGSHTHTISGSNGQTGGGQSHNNMPPYLAVSIWKRTA